MPASLCFLIVVVACLALALYALIAKRRVRVWFKIPLFGTFILEAEDPSAEIKADSDSEDQPSSPNEFPAM